MAEYPESGFDFLHLGARMGVYHWILYSDGELLIK